MKTLIAHEWIAQVGGSENVFEQLLLAVPHDRAVCLWNDNPARFRGINETWLAKSPLRGRKVAAMPLMGSAWKHVDLDGIDRVVVSSHAFSHHLAQRAAVRGKRAFAYVHSPARYVWAPDLDHRGNSALGRLGRSFFRRWDRAKVSEEVAYVANSQFVAERIAMVWGVNASVIHPPVAVERIGEFDGRLSDTEDATLRDLPSEFVLGASRFVRYKNLEGAIYAGQILGLPTVLAGSGPDEARLRAIAEKSCTPVYFTGRVTDNQLLQLYRQAALYVYMAVEDFGIMPVEAMACGTPVLVNTIGGAQESVVAIGGGLATSWQESRFAEPDAVRQALATDMTDARCAVAQFSTSEFRRAISSWVGED